MFFIDIMRLGSNFFWAFRFAFRILWEMYLHYFRLYNLPLLLKRYFEAWRLIHFPEPWELVNSQIRHYRQVTIWTVHGICLLTLIRTVQMAISMLIPMSTHWRMIYWDQMLFQNAIPQLNFIYVTITPFCVFYYYRMYFYRSKKHGQMETIWLAKLVLDESGDPRYSHKSSLDDDVMRIDWGKMKRAVRKHSMFLQYYNLYFGK